MTKDFDMDDFINALRNMSPGELRKEMEFGEKEEKRKKKEIEERAKFLNVQIGHRVKVIEPKERLDENRFNELIGYEGIVLGFNDEPEPFYDYYYQIYFLDEKARKLHDKGGGILFNPLYIENLGEDKEAYQDYVEMLKKQEDELKYRYGKCQDCGGPLMYSGDCIRCKKPTQDTHGDYDFLYLIHHALAQFPDTKLEEKDVWQYFDYDMSFPNDCYKTISFENKAENEELQEVIDYIENNFETKNNEMLVYVSW